MEPYIVSIESRRIEIHNNWQLEMVQVYVCNIEPFWTSLFPCQSASSILPLWIQKQSVWSNIRHMDRIYRELCLFGNRIFYLWNSNETYSWSGTSTYDKSIRVDWWIDYPSRLWFWQCLVPLSTERQYWVSESSNSSQTAPSVLLLWEKYGVSLRIR